MTEPITPGGVDTADLVYPDPTSLESLRRRAGHCAGRPCVPLCGYCGSARQCERCEAITAQLRAERERDEARAEVERLRAVEQRAREADRRRSDETAVVSRGWHLAARYILTGETE